MQYTNLGNTGAKVSCICMGCLSFGDPNWRPWILDRDASKPFFRAAVEHGINFFDTADMYSLGVSEEITGHWLREFANLEETVIASKVYFPMSDKPNMRGLSRKHIQHACENSLKRLGVETIDLYQIHRYDPGTPIEETLSALDQLVCQGKVRYVGASSMYAWQFARMLSASERNGWARFATMQNHYNLLYREEEREMMPLCEAEKVGVIPWSPLARGFLAGTRKSLDDKASTKRSESDDYARKLYDTPSDWQVIDAVRQVAANRGVEAAQIALAWLLSKPAVVAPIVGMTKLEHLETAVAAVEVTLTDDEIDNLEAPYRARDIRGM